MNAVTSGRPLCFRWPEWQTGRATALGQQMSPSWDRRCPLSWRPPRHARICRAGKPRNLMRHEQPGRRLLAIRADTRRPPARSGPGIPPFPASAGPDIRCPIARGGRIILAFARPRIIGAGTGFSSPIPPGIGPERCSGQSVTSFRNGGSYPRALPRHLQARCWPGRGAGHGRGRGGRTTGTGRAWLPGQRPGRAAIRLSTPAARGRPGRRWPWPPGSSRTVAGIAFARKARGQVPTGSTPAGPRPERRRASRRREACRASSW